MQKGVRVIARPGEYHWIIALSNTEEEMIHCLNGRLDTKICNDCDELTFVDARPLSVVAFVTVSLCTPFETLISLAEKVQLVAT